MAPDVLLEYPPALDVCKADAANWTAPDSVGDAGSPWTTFRTTIPLNEEGISTIETLRHTCDDLGLV
jgi:hypothetical protein